MNSRPEVSLKSTGDALQAIGILAAIGIFLVYRSVKSHKRLRHIQDTPRSKSSTAAQGLTELQGFAWPAHGLMQNSRQQDAVYYEFKLQKEKTTGSGENKKTEWVTVYQKSLTSPFYLVDATGLTVIYPEQADFEMILSETRKWRKLKKNEKDHILKKIVTSEISGFPPIEALWGLFSSKFRIIEKSILRGNPLYVSGNFRTTNSKSVVTQSTGLTRFCDMVFNQEARSVRDLKTILDKDKDGKVSENEIFQGFTKAAEVAMSRALSDKLEEKSFEIHGELRWDPNHQLFIAGSHEEYVLKKIKHKPVMYLIGGAVSITAACFVAFSHFGIETYLFKSPSSETKATVTHSSRISPGRFHYECVGNILKSCQYLLSHQTELQLPIENLQFYKQRACQLGDQQYCR